jgi:UPF0755 protein
VEITWPEGVALDAGAALLTNAGIVDHPAAFRALLVATRPFVTPVAGPHFLADDLTPFEVLRRLTRLTSRAHTKVVVPEGFTRFQISLRLEQTRVCSRAAFDHVATDPAWLAQGGIAGDSAEGYLAPATYDLFADSPADGVATEMVGATRKRLSVVQAAHAAEVAGLFTKYGWSERDLLTLASVVEKEAARADELPVIASVFYNRLNDPTFKPARMLQSDPTAAYGCLSDPSLESCQGYAGRVTPAMLRDANNPYNSYRHAGLPPGPIANPGQLALEAVVLPAATDYLFFVAAGDGRHEFSRTLGEHEARIRKGH